MGALLMIVLIYCIGAMIMATVCILNPSISQNYSEFEYFVMVVIWPILLGIKVSRLLKNFTMTVKELKEFLSNVPDEALVGTKEDGAYWNEFNVYEYTQKVCKDGTVIQHVMLYRD